jgi:Pentapeptide repeats (8 copies)
MTADEIKSILELHAKWLKGLADGKRAKLTDADLTDADLTDADLTDAVLTDANLTGAVLTGAVLTGAVLTGADLTGAKLTDAVLTGAVLTGADLTPIRDDIYAVLSSAPAEVEALRLALAEGRVDGSTYDGDCCCLVGTLANARNCDYHDIEGLKPNSARAAERFFMSIRKGDTPETSQACRIALEWVDGWLTRMKAAFAPASAAEASRS